DALAPAEADVLQWALAALVADGAVQRVVDQQELDDRALGLLDALGLRVHDHPVLDRRGAAGLQLADALDLDQAHAARADRVAKLGLVAEHGDLDVAVLGGVDEHRVLRRLHVAAVDRQRDRPVLGPWHHSAPCSSSTCSSSGTGGTSMLRARAASMCASNSGRNLAIIEPIGIAIASPRTHRQLPMMWS